MRIGVDVGGTHTDAVLLDGDTLRASTKARTSDDITTGVVDAVRTILADARIEASAVQMMTLGTTQFTNAVVQRRDLAPVGAIRIGAQSSSALTIGAKWPDDIADMVIGSTRMVDGGYEYDGSEILPLDQAGVDQAVAHFKTLGMTSFAVTSVFATSNPAGEHSVAKALREAIPGARIAMSHELGSLGLYQRENATLLNASLLAFAQTIISAFETAFAALALTCPIFISQNDGTLMRADYARHYPVLTFSSGPTNSMRGAAWLSGLRDAMVVDVGGTTSDVGMLINSFPRQSGAAVKIGGILTNFRMPDVLAVGLGGGSLVNEDATLIGPRSVGNQLTTQALVFGGDTITATDIGVAAGLAQIGDTAKLSNLDPAFVSTAQATMKTMISQSVDKMKTSPDPIPLIVVGGGGFLIPDTLDGISEVICPQNSGVANAIGAAFAQVSGEGETVYTRSTGTREEALAAATIAARKRAVIAGARGDSLEVTDIHETPMTYADEPGATLHVRVVGDVDLGAITETKGHQYAD